MRIESFWLSEAPFVRTVRGALSPLEALWRGGVALRNGLYDAGRLTRVTPPIPAISVGNISVGGTGKTPIAAWIAARLRTAGARPALVLRGYGADEPLVHERLNPDVPVIVNADRVAGAQRARELGCDVAVLDDAFQHRRIRRVSDIVLVAAEQWTRIPRTLPLGPYREPPEGLARASYVLVTRKSATRERAAQVQRELRTFTSAPVGVVSLTLGELRRVGDVQTLPLADLEGARLLVITGIGAPEALAAQLAELGASVDLAAFGDHHRFEASEVKSLGSRAESADLVVCTLKDAVKLEGIWPRAQMPLWYVSQRVDLEDGAPAFDGELRRLLDARSAVQTSTPG